MTQRPSREPRANVFAHLEAGIILCGPDGAIIGANPVACAFLGCREDFLLGNYIAGMKAQIVSRDGMPILQDDLPANRAIRTKKKQPGMVMGIHGPADKAIRWTIVSAAPVFCEGGDIDHVVVSFMDLSSVPDYLPDPGATELALRNLVEFNREIISGAGEGVVVFDKNFHYMVWNRFMEKLTDRSSSSVLGKTATEIFPHIKERGIDTLFLRALKGETVELPAHPCTNPRTGKTSWMAGTYAPHRDSSGDIIGVVGLLRDITGQKEAEDVARKAEERYNALWESTFDLLFVLDERGNFLDANRSCHDLTGFGKGELIGNNLDMVLDAPSLAAALGRIRAILAEGERSRISEFRVRGRHDQIIHVEISSSPIIRDGKPFALQVVARDLTARKNAEKCLRESETRFRSLVDSSFDFVYVHDFGGRCLDANKACFEVTGYAQDDFAKLDLASILHPESLTVALALLEELLKSGHQDRLTEYRIRCKDGSWLDLETSSSLLYRDGKPWAVQGVGRDITPRKRFEEEIRRSEERFRTIFEQARLGMVMTDKEYRFVRVNEALCSMLGYSREELLGKNYLDITLPGHTGGDLDNIHKLERGELQMYRTRKPYVHKDGHVVWGDLAVSIVYGGRGTPLFGLAMIEDVTARKKTEEDLSRIEKIESLKVLAGGIAHDFNNLLCGVFGYLDLARETLEPGCEALTYLDKAFSSFDRAKSLARQMLTFAKGGAPIKKTLSLAPIIRDSCGLALSGAKVKATLAIDESLRNIEGDEHQLSQVFSNIVINAVQAMPDGGRLSIAARNRSLVADQVGRLPEGSYVTVAVTDEGVGIPEKIISRIFDPFFTTKNQGSGLGLATSFSIVERHGGHIEADSKPGEGSTFTIFLPSTDRLAVEQEDETGTAADLRGSGRILIMDDECTVRDIARDILVAAGYEVLVTAEGSEAVARYREAWDAGAPFDAVILDLTVPGGMGGEKAMAALLEIDPAVIGIVSSGYSDNPVVSDFAAYGFTAIAPKPYRSRDLLKTVKAVASRKRATGKTGPSAP